MAYWPKLSSKIVVRALSGHRVIGVALAAVLYIIALSGTIAVFNHELQRWEQPNAPEISAIAPAAVARAGDAFLTLERAEGKPQTSHFFIQLPTDDMPRVVLTTDNGAVFVDSAGNIAGEEAHSWTQFLLDLHYYLHLPHLIGITLVGVLGVMLLSLSISGFIAHPRVFRDAFVFRFNGNKQLTYADIHNRLSVWTAPFHISLALTGAMIGLMSIVAYAIASLDYDGEIAKVYDPIFGVDPAPNEASAPLANIERALTHMNETFPELTPTYVILHEPMTAGQHMEIIAQHPRRLIFGEYYNYDQAGTFLGNTGMVDGALGQQVAASVYSVHFGDFGGLPVKFAYVAFGVALMMIISFGMQIYFVKRRQKARGAPQLERLWASVVWGAPASLALSMVAAVAGFDNGPVLTAVFWLGLLGCMIAAALHSRSTADLLRQMTGVLLSVAMIVHVALYRDGFSSPAAIAVTLGVLGIALALVAPEIRIMLARLRLAGHLSLEGREAA